MSATVSLKMKIWCDVRYDAWARIRSKGQMSGYVGDQLSTMSMDVTGRVDGQAYSIVCEQVWVELR